MVGYDEAEMAEMEYTAKWVSENEAKIGPTLIRLAVGGEETK